MNQRQAFTAVACLASCLLAVIASAQTPASTGTSAIVSRNQPLSFEENRGQAGPRVRYISRARNYTVALTDDEALLMVRKSPQDAAVVRMRLAGESRAPRITAHNPQPGKVYYAKAGARGPLTPIDTFARVEYAGVYPGIDLVYYGDDRRLEFDFVVAPQADPDRIALTLDGADGLALTDAGDVSMRVGAIDLTLAKPVVYQDRPEGRVDIPAVYQLAADSRTVRFRLGKYDPTLPLVIDPTWMTISGSAGEDSLAGLVVDSAGQPRVLGSTFDPTTFGASHIEQGVQPLPPPNCFFTKLDATTGLNSYTILFENAQACATLAISPNDVAYFTGFVYPNGFANNQGTTIIVVDDRGGVPVVRTVEVANYDSSAVGEGVEAITVNSLEHVFLIGPCRLAGPGDPALELSGYNETPDPANTTYAEGCSVPSSPSSEMYQPLLTVVDETGQFLYGSFLSPGEFVSRYGLAADDADRAYVVGARSTTLSPTLDAYRGACPAAGGPDACGYLMVLDTTSAGAASLVYASYLWNTENVETIIARLDPSGGLYVASEGRVFDDFPSNRPTNPASWQYSVFPGLSEGVQVARFRPGPSGLPTQFDFAMVFDPSRAVAALAGQTVRDALADLRLFPSGAPAVASIAYTQNPDTYGIVTTFTPDVNRVGEAWVHTLGTHSPAAFAVGTDSGAGLFTAGQIDGAGGQGSDLFVERVDAIDPGANQPPTVSIQGAFNGLLLVYADSPSGGTAKLNALASDPEGDFLTYSWTGPFTDNPVTTDSFLIARLGLGMLQTVTVTVDDGHGNVVSASYTVDVLGTPFVGGVGTPIDSEVNGLYFGYTPVTITPTAILGGAGNTYLRTRLDQNPPVPSNLQAGSPPIYFDISTDAIIQAPIAVCLDTAGMSFADPNNIRLYHYQQSGQLGSWVDVTSNGYPQGQQLCGQANTLGTFAIFYPQVPSTAVRTIAGNGVLANGNDGPGGNPSDDYVDGPATSTPLGNLFGGAFDRTRNHLYVSAEGYILRVDLTDNTVQRVAGSGVFTIDSIDGPGGDSRDDLVEGGNAFTTYVGYPGDLALTPTGDVVFFDRNSCRIRRLDLAQGRLYAVAGNGVCGSSGDGSSMSQASLSYGQMAFDAAGNLFLAERNSARVRRMDAVTNIIETVAGDGTFGTPANGAPALSTISMPAGIAFDAQGHLLIAGGMHLLRVSTGTDSLVNGDGSETISIIGGCNTNCGVPFNGDGLAVAHPQVYLPGMASLTVAQDGAIIFPDYFRIRRIAPGADGIVTGASDEIVTTIGGYYDFDKSTQPNFNGDTFSTQSLFGTAQFVVDDNQDGIIVVDGNNYRVRRFGLAPSPVDANAADLTIGALASPDPVSAGADLRYLVTVTNNGPAGATNVTMTYAMPAGAAFQSATGVSCDAPAVGSTGTVTCYFGTLASGASHDVLITVKPHAAGGFSSTFSVAADELDSSAGNNTTSVTSTVNAAPLADAIIEIVENVSVTDAVVVTPAAMIVISETVVVGDTPAVLPSVMIGVNEGIVVNDDPRVEPEQVAALVLTLSPVTATGPTNQPHTVTASVDDGSALAARVVVEALGSVVRVQFVNPQAANQPLAVAVSGSDIVVTLATGADGALTSTAAHVVAALNASPNVISLATARLWPGTTGTGVVQPRALTPLRLVQFSSSGPGGFAYQCAISVPGFCAGTYTSATGGTDLISAYLDANANGTQDAGDPSATADKTWTAPPFVDAGPNQIVEATSVAGANVSLSGVVQNIIGSPTLTWSGSCGSASGANVTLSCASGSHTITFTVNNGQGTVLSDTVAVTVRDTTAPALTLPADITTFFAPAPAGAPVTFTATAIDIVSGTIVPSCSPVSGFTFPIGTTTVTCTATDAAGNQGTGSFTVTVPAPPAPSPTLTLPGNISTIATSAAGAIVTYTATAHVPGFSIDLPALCLPISGSTFPIGTTTVNCSATNPLGPPPLSFPATGSFSVTVTLGTPNFSVVIQNKGRDPDGSFWLDMRFTNTGTGHARNVSIASVAFRTLNGVGTVTYNATRSGPLPRQLGALDAGQSQTVRFYLNVPLTVTRFSLAENGTLQNVQGTTFSFAPSQTVFP